MDVLLILLGISVAYSICLAYMGGYYRSINDGGKN